MVDKTLGEQNGTWLVLFKLMSIITPVMCVGVGWMVSQLMTIRTEMATSAEWQRQAERDRFRREDGYELESRIQAELLKVWKAIGDLPSVVDFTDHEERLDEVEKLIGVLKVTEHEHSGP
jgi:hypothetical protein